MIPVSQSENGKGVFAPSLFIFGSFSEGMVHFNKIAPYVNSVESAAIQGTLYRCPSGLIVMTKDGLQTIAGHVAKLDKAEILLALLDSFHGVLIDEPHSGLFTRQETLAFFDHGQKNGSSAVTSAYFMNTHKLPRGSVIIEGANWKKSLAEQPPLFSRLTDRQKSYIQKLGGSSGRDIVPIDLALYRELMHLEIVVDKGRRLALSPLGQDLYRLLS